ncbi:cytochrome b [soil metagenome]
MSTNQLNLTTPISYDTRTIFLHWASAALVAGLWIIGQTIDFFPTGTARIMVRSLHILFGGILGILLVARLSWRRHGGIKLPPANADMTGRLAISVHYLLYALLLAIVVIGVACVWIRGDNLFNLITVPAFDPGNKALRHDAVELHGLVANILLAVAGFHAAAALWHHFMQKDGVLRRMLPNLK